MASDVSRKTLVGLMVPWQLSESDLISADSSYTQDGPGPGGSKLGGTGYRLQVHPAGAQDGTTYEVVTRSAGDIVPGGAGGTWRKSTDADSLERGWDPPSVAHYTKPLRWTSVERTTEPHCVRLNDGRQLTAAYETAGSAYRVQLYLLDFDGTITEAQAYSQSSAPTSALSSSLHPSLCVLSDGSIRLGYLLEDTHAEEAWWQVCSVSIAEDLTITTTIISQISLNIPLDLDTGASNNGLVIARARMASTVRNDRDEVSLVFWGRTVDTSHSNRDAYVQYGSTSGALRFERVELASKDADADADPLTWGWFDLIGYMGRFLLHFNSSVDETTQVFLPHAYAPISQQGTTAINALSGFNSAARDGGAKYLEFGDRALWAEPGGMLYTSIRNRDSSRGATLIVRSDDYGQTWEAMGAGLGSSDNSWFASGDTNIHPQGFSACAALGRSWVATNHNAPTSTSFEQSLTLFGLGGNTTVTQQTNSQYGHGDRRSAWSYMGLPWELPGSTTPYTANTAGSFSQAIANGYLDTSTSTGQLYYSKTLTVASLRQGWSGRFAFMQDSGGSATAMRSGIEVHIEGGGSAYTVQIRTQRTPPRIELWDGGGTPAVIASLTVDWSNAYEVRIEVRQDNVDAYYRVWNGSPDQAWSLLGHKGNLTAATVGGTSYLYWGPSFVTGSTASMKWYWWPMSDDEEAGRRPEGLPYTNPRDVVPRSYAGPGGANLLDNGLLLSASGGPGAEGESYTIAPVYSYPVSALHWPDSFSPRLSWRSTAGTSDAAAASFAWRIAPTASRRPLVPFLGVHIAGLAGSRTITIGYKTSGSYTDLETDLALGIDFSFTRQGGTVFPSDAATKGRYIHLDACVDWWLRLDDGEGNEDSVAWRKVAANGDGVLAGSTTSRRVLFELADADDAEPASGTATLCPVEVVVMIPVLGSPMPRGEAIKVSFKQEDTPDNRHAAGVLWVGEVHVPGRRWEYGARYTQVPGTDYAATDDRIGTPVQLAPEQVEFELGYTALLSDRAVYGESTEPPVVYTTTATSRHPVGVPAATRQTMEGIARRCKGTARPVVVIRDFPQTTTTAATVLRWPHAEFIRARITGNLSTRRVTKTGWRVEAIPMVSLP